MAVSNVALWQSAVDGLNAFILEVGQPMELQTRSIKAPNFGSVDFSQDFQQKVPFIGAIDTGQIGKTTFDGTSIEQRITHIIYLEFIENVTAEDWVLYDNRRFDIINVEDVGELNGILKLECNERGTISNSANEA